MSKSRFLHPPKARAPLWVFTLCVSGAGANMACTSSRTPARHAELSQGAGGGAALESGAESGRLASPDAAQTRASGFSLPEQSPILQRGALVRAVLRRNPSLAAARHAVRAASLRYHSASGLDDPMLSYAFAPLSVAPGNARFGQMVTLTQKLPWPGKRALAGEMALAEAEARRQTLEVTRQELAFMASVLFDRYYAVTRSLELNREHVALLTDIRRAAVAQYETGRGTQQEPLQAEVELGHVERQRIVLESRRAVVLAEMNGLLHRAPEAALPPPPSRLERVARGRARSRVLRAEALSNRPDLRAKHAVLQGQRAGRELAERAYFPDFGVMAGWSSMAMMPEHEWTLGFMLEIPLARDRRSGNVDEAEARIAETEAEIAATEDAIAVEVETARRRLIEAEDVVDVYEKRLLPVSDAQIEAARAEYVTGRGEFQALIDAERSQRSLELDYEAALGELGERRAGLLFALGRITRLTRGAP